MADDKSAASITSTDSHGIDPKNPKTWRVHLTPEHRANFESKGTEIVRDEVLRRVHKDPRKHFAALYWLREKRANKRNLVLLGVFFAGVGVVLSVLSYLRS